MGNALRGLPGDMTGLTIETGEVDEDFARCCDPGDRDDERCDQCGDRSSCLLNGLCPICHETGGGVLHLRRRSN